MSTTSLPPISPPATQRTAEARAAFTASLTAVGASLSADLTARARNIHQNATALEAQEKQLKKGTKELRREREGVERWLGKNGGGDGGKGMLSEFDDLEGLVEGLEGELEGLEAWLGVVEGEEGLGSGSEGQEQVEGGKHKSDEGEVLGGRASVADADAGDEGVHATREGVEERLEDLHVSDTAKGKQRAV